ncbi:hypothetical protein J2TS4_34610 [Paenibacillus sp. J2TS4]|nr:hypothetical protein J2TS4_34610 [Paenibacillus sp. J2TS4]
MHRPHCPTKTVFDPPIRVVENVFHPQIVQVIQPVEIIRKHHCVPIPHRMVAPIFKDEFCTVSNRKLKRKR